MSELTTQWIAELLEAWNSRNPERVAGWYTEDCYGMDVAIAVPQIGREGVRRMFEAYWHAFPDLEITSDEVVAEDDRVALIWTARGTHKGSIMNIPATGRAVSVQGVNRLVLQDGKVRETLTIWDVAGMLRGLGLLPEL